MFINILDIINRIQTKIKQNYFKITDKSNAFITIYVYNTVIYFYILINKIK